jgi:4-hydroxy-2-oxoheptanedioate aldolase
MNRFKQGLQQGRAQIGLWQALASPYCAEICAGAGSTGC